MFTEERHKKILEMLKKNERVEVLSLSELFQVSQDTIRRDLRIMEKKGVLSRTHGGAILPNKAVALASYATRTNLHKKEKCEIAQLAATFIEDGDAILLDGSTTVSRLVPFLYEFKNLTIITNAISIAHDITQTPSDMKLFIIGGLVHQPSSNTISYEAIQTLQKLHVDKAFIGTCTLSPTKGFGTTLIEEAPVKEAMIKAAGKVFFMADSSKFLEESLVTVAPVESNHIILTDSGFSQDMAHKFQPLLEKGLKIYAGKR
ncbi:DeoR/GlpR family transcriptional regulator of sugar metabolism [Anaerosolibacter carboniphilus]|uniref:DeoR/GlpR family transcriptional regulator of sugar metabolism n=1 Tax=Anaerosolibacter carboniphilus TaxID=1417629 RepID=A0A841KPK1_9FIRM|nr:DeoR/GlpR family DNA-binding transcription regulator [Anaerosolibacter carboniphilus]MBB6215353.1 DeoR/GlpR family transcriptional regulator of sugar metabolism [Anaerosolibacter carboniphilus]